MAHEPLDEDDLDAQLALRVQTDARIAQLDLAFEFEAAGFLYSELDEAGRIVTHHPPARPT